MLFQTGIYQVGRNFSFYRKTYYDVPAVNNSAFSFFFKASQRLLDIFGGLLTDEQVKFLADRLPDSLVEF